MILVDNPSIEIIYIEPGRHIFYVFTKILTNFAFRIISFNNKITLYSPNNGK